LSNTIGKMIIIAESRETAGEEISSLLKTYFNPTNCIVIAIIVQLIEIKKELYVHCKGYV